MALGYGSPAERIIARAGLFLGRYAPFQQSASGATGAVKFFL